MTMRHSPTYITSTWPPPRPQGCGGFGSGYGPCGATDCPTCHPENQIQCPECGYRGYAESKCPACGWSEETEEE